MEANDTRGLASSVGSRIVDILDRPPIAMVKKFIEPTRLELFIAVELNKLKDAVNIDDRLNLQPQQIPAIAEELLRMYPTESLEDFVLCFRRGALGVYGMLYRIDAGIIQDWMSKYLDEKYNLIEAGYREEKENEPKESVINYDSFKQRATEFIKPERHTNANENEYQRFRLQYLEERRKQIEQSTGSETEEAPSE